MGSKPEEDTDIADGPWLCCCSPARLRDLVAVGPVLSGVLEPDAPQSALQPLQPCRSRMTIADWCFVTVSLGFGGDGVGRRGRVSFVPWNELVGSCGQGGSPNPARVTGQCPLYLRPECIFHVVGLPVRPYISGQCTQGQIPVRHTDLHWCKRNLSCRRVAVLLPFALLLLSQRELSRKGILPLSSGLRAMPGTLSSTADTTFLTYSTF